VKDKDNMDFKKLEKLNQLLIFLVCRGEIALNPNRDVLSCATCSKDYPVLQI